MANGLVVGDCFYQKDPNWWANTILRVNGYAYTQGVLEWWVTKGKYIHGNNIAFQHVRQLTDAMANFIKIHAKYDKKIIVHLKNKDLFIRLINSKNNPDFYYEDCFGKVVYKSHSISVNRDKKPFKSLSSIIKSIENTFKEKLIHIEIKENK